MFLTGFEINLWLFTCPPAGSHQV